MGNHDMGIKQNGDKILDTFANNHHTALVTPCEMLFRVRTMDRFALIMTGVCFILALIIILLVIVDEHMDRRGK